MSASLEFQNRLKKLRKDNGYSLEALGEELELSKSVLSYYENGKRFPNITTLKRISDFFDVSFDYLVGNDRRVVSENNKTRLHMSNGEIKFIKEIRKYDMAHQKIISDPERTAKFVGNNLK